MSEQAREALVNHPNLIFQRDSQRLDLLDVTVTQTGLIALLQYLCIEKNHPIELTAVKTDHHDDSYLGEHCHFNGYCADLWPLSAPSAGDYLAAGEGAFQSFLRDVAQAPTLFQIGLAGTAQTSYNDAAAGPTVFDDDGADHVHVGAVNP